jgi:hypothetical protein
MDWSRLVEASKKFGSDSPGLLVEAATVHKEGMQFIAISLFCSTLVLGVSIYISVAMVISKK